VPVGALAAGGQSGVRRGQVGRRDRVAAEGDVGPGAVGRGLAAQVHHRALFAVRLRHAQPHGQITDQARADPLRERIERGVQRVLHRHVERAHRALQAVLVAQRHALPVGELARRRAVPQRRVPHPELLGRGQHDRLERGRRRPGRGRVVEEAPPTVAAVVRADPAGGRVDRHQRGPQVLRLALQRLVDRRRGGLLGRGVDGGDDP
jgi:hypothetical protein